MRSFEASGLLMFLVLSASSAAAERPFTVEDLLSLERVCKIVFGPSDDALLIERVAAYKDSNAFVEPWQDLGWNRTKLYIVDLRRPSEIRPLFEDGPHESQWFGSFSPKRSKVTVYHRSELGTVEGGIYDFKQRSLVPFRRAPDLPGYFGPFLVWLSETSLVYAAVPPGRQPLDYGMRTIERLSRLWKDARLGAFATVSVLRSGRLDDPAALRAPGFLLKKNARNGKQSVLARASFLELRASPDGHHVAALKRGTPLLPKSGDRIAHRALVSHSPLVLYDSDAPSKETSVCSGCDAMPGTIRWSLRGDELLAFLHRRQEGWENGRYYRYQLSTGSLTAVLPDRLEPVRTTDYIAPPVRAEWLGNRVLIYARPADTADGAARPDWYLVDGKGLAINMTASFPAVPADLAAVSEDALYLVSGGDLWRVANDGTRRNLTGNIDIALKLWRPPHDPGCGRPRTLHAPRIVLQPEDDAGTLIMSLDIATGKPTTVKKPTPEAELLAMAHERSDAVFLERSRGGASRLVLVVDGRTVPLLELNTHMTDVAPATYTRIADPDDIGATHNDWLLLPPDHQPGQRHPLIVYIYPGLVQRAQPRWSPYQPHPLNPHLLAAHGFAVLFPSIPLTPEGKPGDPMLAITERLMAAIDRVIEKGYADPDRIGLFGHSYGAYGVLGIISQTDRFKAAVAANGISNLIDNYGTFDIRFKIDAPEALRPFAVGWSESGQGRLGAPPWRDAARYLRNSPLFYVDKVHTPLMLIHGDLDYVSMAQSEQMFTALYRLNRDAVFLRYWGEGHVLASPANIRDFWKRVFAWYERYLGPVSGMSTPCDLCPAHQGDSSAPGGSDKPG